MNNLEQTLSIIKPDAVERNLETEIKEMFRSNGFSILKEKKIQIDKSEAEKFYKVHETKPFYNDLCDYLSSGPIVVMVLEKENDLFLNIIDPAVPLFMPPLFTAFLEFSNKHWRQGKKLLIHCNQGEPRAPSLALLFVAT